MAVTPDSTRVYVVYNSGMLAVIDAATNTVTATTPLAGGATQIALNPAGTRGYVTIPNDQTIAVIDTATNGVVAVIHGITTQAIAVNPAGTEVYTPDFGGFTDVISTSTNSVVGTITGAGGVGAGVGFNPVGTRAYVPTNGTGTNLSTIDTTSRTVVDTSSVLQSGSHLLDVSLTTGLIYVANTDSNTVSVVRDTPLPPATVTLSPAAGVDPVGRRTR